jgi:Subtilase family
MNSGGRWRIPRAIGAAVAAALLAVALMSLPFGLPIHHAALADSDKDHGHGHDKDKDHDNGHGNDNGNGGGKGKDKDKGSNASDDNPSAGGPGQAKPGGAMSDEAAPDGHDRIVRSEIVVADADERLSDFARAKGFRVLHSEMLAALGLKVTRLQAPAGISTAQARNLIAREFPDAIVDLNHLYQPQASLSLPAADYAGKAVRWNPRLRECGNALRLGLIDTAVDWSLPILNGARGQTADFLESGNEPAPKQHGTGIATLLVGQENFGLLPGAELYAAGIFGVDDSGRPFASATSFAAALNWLLVNRVGTINVSLSGPPDRLMALAVKRAQDRGAKLVAAVGNDGTNDVPRFPAAYPGVIGVTAVDEMGQVFSGANHGDFVALAAPGVDLWIPGQPGDGDAAAAGDRLVTGTSFAVPYVTATLASYGNDSKRMLATAADLGAPGPDPVFGHGLVQAPTTCISAVSVQ